MTDAGLVMPAIPQLRIGRPQICAGRSPARTLRAGVALMLALLYAGPMVRTRLNQSVTRIANCQQRKDIDRAGCRVLLISILPQPETVEGLALHTPAFHCGTAWFLRQELIAIQSRCSGP